MISPSIGPRFSAKQPARHPKEASVRPEGRWSEKARKPVGLLGGLMVAASLLWGGTTYVQTDKAYDGKVDIVTVNPANFDEAETRKIEDALTGPLWLGTGGILATLWARRRQRPLPPRPEN